MLSVVKRNLINNLKNIPGWRSNRKIVVFESDDWGSLRIGSAAQLESLVKSGVIKGSANSYDRLDSLESKEDMELLFEVLTAVKDSTGSPAVFTPFVNPCNPDFARIEADNFSRYYYEPFDVTLKRYGQDDVMNVYAEGISKGIFLPEYHGREHVHVASWMKALQHREPAVIEGFNHEFTSVNLDTSPKFLEAFRPTYYFENEADVAALRASVIEGAKVFLHLFKYKTTVFDAPNAIFHPGMEDALHQIGINNIVLQRFRSEPDGKGALVNKYYRFGERNAHGQIYHIRNCMFEPRIGMDDAVCMNMVKAAFRWGKPAVITTHRVNYMGGIVPENRAKSLLSLSRLLKNILKTWPDAEFMSSAAFAKLMHNS